MATLPTNVSFGSTIVEIEGEQARIATRREALQNKLTRMGFEPVEERDDWKVFETPASVIEITSRALNRPKRNLSAKERKAVRDRLQAGKAAKRQEREQAPPAKTTRRRAKAVA